MQLRAIWPYPSAANTWGRMWGKTEQTCTRGLIQKLGWRRCIFLIVSSLAWPLGWLGTGGGGQWEWNSALSLGTRWWAGRRRRLDQWGFLQIAHLEVKWTSCIQRQTSHVPFREAKDRGCREVWGRWRQEEEKWICLHCWSVMLSHP